MPEIQLFGGAIVTMFPSKYIDVSNFRTVPDHQEVWTEDKADSPLAFICEILEYKNNVKDEDSAKFFFDDLASLNNNNNKATNEVISTKLIKNKYDSKEKLSLAHLPEDTMIHLLKGRSIVNRNNDGALNVDCITWLANIRLPRVTTDILITLTLPLSQNAKINCSSKTNKVDAVLDDMQNHGENTFYYILKHFGIKNWGLFG